MKKLIQLIAICCILTKAAVAQINLVPNPSFEDTVECPHYASQIDKAVGWHTSAWTPDYFHDCNWLNGNTSIPQNYRGYQYAQDGHAYSGILTYSSGWSNFSETMTCQLLSPLIIGQKYLFSFYVSEGDLFYRLSANKLGVLLSTVNYDTASPPPMNNYCQFYSDSIITDTLNWVLLKGSFIADSNYTYYTIGRFYDDAHTDTICSPPFYPYAYYYIDNISLIGDTTTSVFELKSTDKIMAFPNPCIDKLSIRITENVKSKIEIIDAFGNKLQVQKEGIEHETLILNVSNLKKGIYLLKFFSETNLQRLIKFIKI